MISIPTHHPSHIPGPLLLCQLFLGTPIPNKSWFIPENSQFGPFLPPTRSRSLLIFRDHSQVVSEQIFPNILLGRAKKSSCLIYFPNRIPTPLLALPTENPGILKAFGLGENLGIISFQPLAMDGDIFHWRRLHHVGIRDFLSNKSILIRGNSFIKSIIKNQ